MEHPYFASLDKEALHRKELSPPYLPEISAKDHIGTYFKLKTDSKSVSDTMIPNTKIKVIKKYDKAFSEF
jgi:hypothetical protein